MDGLPPDFSLVVKANKARTLGWVVAEREPCLSVQDEESRKIQRRLKPVAPIDLPRVQLPSSWFLAVLLCPGDDTDAIAAWAKQLSPQALERIRFYCHPDVDLYHAFAGWRKTGPAEPDDEGAPPDDVQGVPQGVRPRPQSEDLRRQRVTCDATFGSVHAVWTGCERAQRAETHLGSLPARRALMIVRCVDGGAS